MNEKFPITAAHRRYLEAFERLLRASTPAALERADREMARALIWLLPDPAFVQTLDRLDQRSAA